MTDNVWMPIATAPEHKEIIAWRKDAGIFLAINTTIELIIDVDNYENKIDQVLFDENHWYYGDTQGHGLLDKEFIPTLWIKLGDPLH